MSVVLERVTEPISFKEGRMAFPEADEAIEVLREHAGETFAEFRFTSLAVGKIADDKEPLTFYKSGYGQDDIATSVYAAIKTDGGTVYRLAWSGAGGGWPIETGAKPIGDTFDTYVGHLKGEITLPHGPHKLHISERIEDARSLDRLRTTLVVGNRACGSFGIGKALKEIEESPRNIHTSMGLGLVALLEECGVDWRPVTDCEVSALDEAMEQLTEGFVNDALVPLMLDSLHLRGSFLRADNVGNRASVFGFDHTDLRSELVAKVLYAEQTDERVAERMTWQRSVTEPRGDYVDYVRDGIANVLSNQLGIKPVAKAE